LIGDVFALCVLCKGLHETACDGISGGMHVVHRFYRRLKLLLSRCLFVLIYPTVVFGSNECIHVVSIFWVDELVAFLLLMSLAVSTTQKNWVSSSSQGPLYLATMSKLNLIGASKDNLTADQ